MAFSRVLLVAALACGTSAATLRGSMWHQLAADMQPSVVAHLLSEVEHGWEEHASAALRGEMSNATAVQEVEQSCQKIGRSIIGGSAGNKGRVEEYLKDVCATDQDEHDMRMCQAFAQRIQTVMSDDEYFNREELNLDSFCAAFYEEEVVAEAVAAKKRVDLLAAEKIKQEEQAARAKAAKEAQEKADQIHKEVLAAVRGIKDSQEAEKKAESITNDMAKDDKSVEDARQRAQKEVQVADEKEAQEAEQEAKVAQEEAEEKRRKIQEEQARRELEEAERKAEAEKLAAQEAAKKAAEKAAKHKAAAEAVAKSKHETKDEAKAEAKEAPKAAAPAKAAIKPAAEAKKEEKKEEKPAQKVGLVAKARVAVKGQKAAPKAAKH